MGKNLRRRQTLQQAIDSHRQGNLAEAERLYRSLLIGKTSDIEAMQYLGLLYMQQNRPAEALPLFTQALALNPTATDALTACAGALMQLGRAAEAIEKLDALQALRPNDADVHYNRGVVLAALGRNPEAAAAYRCALAIRPDHWSALFNLGNQEAVALHYAEAIRCYDKVLALAPGHVDVLNNSGNVLAKLGRLEEALQRFGRALTLRPDNVQAITNRANTLKELARHEEALAEYGRALAIDPNHVEAMFNLGNTLLDLGRPAEAIVSLQKAIGLRPNAANIHASYATALFEARRADEAILAYREAIRLAPEDAVVHSDLIFALNFDSTATAADHQSERKRWARRFEHLRGSARVHSNQPDPHRRLRIGYFSPYFREQAATFSFGGVLVSHDAERFEIVCYSDTKAEDAVTDRIRECAAIWHRTVDMSDDELAELVRADAIDIMIDLVGHMKGQRPGLFARKPAPVQVTAWGEPTGTGLAAIDYLLADPVLVPPPERALLAEQVFDLPNFIGFWSPDELPQPGPLPGRDRGYITFGTFNRLSKLLDPVLGVWAQVLRAVPDARLLLKDAVFDGVGQRAQILALLDREGIAAERVTLLGRSDRAGHFGAYRDMDIALDPFPHSGGMTTLDALWMGVPVITCPGSTISSRLAAASLTALGLTDLVASNMADYVARAADLARDVDALDALRSTLRPRVAASAIGDPRRYTRAVEAAYREMWRRWCESQQRSTEEMRVQGA